MARPIGRPVGRDSTETRRRILDAARRLFAERGFAQTPQTLIAEHAGITPAAVRFHFQSRAQIYEVLYTESIDHVLEIAGPRIDAASSFFEKVDALLSSLPQLRRVDHHMASFAASAPVEVQRHAELRHLAKDRRLVALYTAMAASAVDEGVLETADEKVMRAMLSAAMFGLSQLAPTVSMAAYESYVAAFTRLFAGTLWTSR